MKETKESAPESKTQGLGGLRLKGKRGII